MVVKFEASGTTSAVDVKYKDVYTSSGDTQSGNYGATLNKNGDIVYETSSSGNGSNSWYGDYSQMPSYSDSFFIIGDCYAFETNSGLFAFYSTVNMLIVM